MSDLTEKLRPHVKDIMESAAAGNDHAAAVMTLYGMHRKCPGDPGAIGLCEAAFDDWRRSLQQTK